MGAYEYTAGITFTPNRSGSGNPGKVVSYSHTLTNAGAGPDTFSISTSSSQGWSVTTNPAGPVALAGGQSTSIVVNITIPAGTAISTSDTTTVTATSDVDPTLTASVTDTTLVVPFEIDLPLIVR